MNIGILAIIGSGEFTEEMEEVDQFLLKKTPNPVVAIIPTAAGEEENYEEWIENGIGHFEKLGANVRGVHLIKRVGTEDKKILNQLGGSNFYYFSGGNPGYLLDTIKNSKAWNLIYSRFVGGATLVGSSAGAMVMGEKVWSRVYEFRRVIVKPWESGLGVLDFGIVPHYDYITTNFSKGKLVKMRENYPKDVPIIGIDENTAYIRLGRKWTTMGKGKVHKLQ